VVLDLDGGGVSTRSLAQGVQFDIDGDGRLDQTGWVGSGEGLLVRDLDGDGVVDSGAELFGSATTLADGSKADNGFDALAALDSNSDGRIDAQDKAFAELKVWVDADADGVTDAGELKTLAQAGVVSIGLNAQTDGARRDQGNIIGLVSGFERADGSQGEAADVWFQVSSSEALDEQAVAMGAALKGYASTASGAASNAQAVGVAGVDAAAAATDDKPTMAPAQSTVHSLAEALKRYELDLAMGHLSQGSVGRVIPAEKLGVVEKRDDKGLLGGFSGSTGGGD
jgi:hypothetical protein